MKESHEFLSIGVLCKFFNISRQAYYQYGWRLTEEYFQGGLLPDEIRDIRLRHPRMGARKLQELLSPFMREHGIKPGRDGLFDFLSMHGLPVRRRKRSARTTRSFHRLKKYPGLIVDFTPSTPDELWVSDITCWKTGETTVYISFITDAFSRKIVGYHLSETLHAEETSKALIMALSGAKKYRENLDRLIHHSDRGVQYCSSLYVNRLKKNRINISMTQSGDPLENSIAERVNGIIKDEYLLNYHCDNINDARELLCKAVALYNKERPHG